MALENRISLPGLFLVIAGLLWLFYKLALLETGIFLTALGGLFLGFYFLSRYQGIYLAGGLITFAVIATFFLPRYLPLPFFFTPALFFYCTAIAFLLFYLFHNRRYDRIGTKNWPLLPAFLLFILGGFISILEYGLLPQPWLQYLHLFWPFALTMAGFFLTLIHQQKKSR